ncbi:MAG TPA: LysR family transcriptional regulator, partial [Candidatus Binatia bacterium]|nr:LysR family transcriptional regulator [Candidatus Binatia bacterium]
MEYLNPVELQAFVTLAEHLHFGRAAELLHVTQPALSKQIQRLEDKVGGPLVVR